jgi:hypothetical protein
MPVNPRQAVANRYFVICVPCKFRVAVDFLLLDCLLTPTPAIVHRANI